MATNAPETRKTHVVRIYGTNKAGDVLHDIWADVERMDRAKNAYQDDDGSWQGMERRLRWWDNPDNDDYSADTHGPPSRKTIIVKVCRPDEEDLQDPGEWIPIPAIRSIRTKFSDQGRMVRLLNTDLNQSRVVEKRRILHYDTNIDDRAQTAADADSELKTYVVPGDEYTRDENTEDDGQYVEHEVIKFLKSKTSGETKTGAGSDEGKQTKLLNQYLIDESEEAKLEELGENQFNPPYRLDPYQNIINVNFGGATEFLWNPIAIQAPTDNENGAVQIPSVATPDSFYFTFSAFAQLKWSGAMPASGNMSWVLFQSISNQAANTPEVADTLEFNNIVQALTIYTALSADRENVLFFAVVESRPLDVTPYIVDIGEPYSRTPVDSGEGPPLDGVPVIVPIELPLIQHKQKLVVSYNSDPVPLSEVTDNPFHLFITIDTSTPTEFSTQSVRWEGDDDTGGVVINTDRSYIDGAQFNVRINNRSIEVQNAFSTVSGVNVPAGGIHDGTDYMNPTFIVVNSGDHVTHFVDYNLNTASVVVPHVHDHNDNDGEGHLTVPGYTDLTAQCFWQVPTTPAQKIAWSGMAVGVPFATDASPLTPLEGTPANSITMQSVQVWTDQVIPASAVPTHFIDDKGNPRPVSVAQEAFGKSTFVLDGGPKTFAANAKGSGPKLTLVGAERTHNRLKQPT